MNSSIIQSIKKLESYFEKFELLPAQPNLLPKIKELYPNITPDLIEFYECCDGFSGGFDIEGSIIFSLDRIIELTEGRSGDNPLFTILFPIRNDGGWNFDCSILSDEGKNSIVYWDGETSAKPDYPIAGNLENFFTHFTDWAITCFNKDGTYQFKYDLFENNDSEYYDWPCDVQWTAKRDKALKGWLTKKEYRLLFDTELEAPKKGIFGF